MHRRSTILGLFALLWLGAAAPAGADELQDQIERADALMKDQQHQQALALLQAAYAQRQAPRLIYQMARAQQRLGLTGEALKSYQRYLTAETDPEPAQRADAEAQLAVLKGLLAAAQPAPPRPGLYASPGLGPLRYELRPSTGLIVTGAVLLGLGYTGSILTGSLLLTGSSATDSHGDIRAASGTLLIPVVGPLIGSLVYRQPAWSIPLSLLDFIGQAGGLAMIIVGVKVRHQTPVIGHSLLISPYSTLGGGGLQAMGRF